MELELFFQHVCEGFSLSHQLNRPGKENKMDYSAEFNTDDCYGEVNCIKSDISNTDILLILFFICSLNKYMSTIVI